MDLTKKQIILIIKIIFVTSAFLYACEDNNIPIRDGIALEETKIILSSNTNQKDSINFRSTLNWEAKADEGWITIPDEYKKGEAGDNFISIKVDPNKSEIEREGRIIISSIDGEHSESILILQEVFKN